MKEFRKSYKDAVNYLIRSMVVTQSVEGAGEWLEDFMENYKEVQKNNWHKNMMGNNTPMPPAMFKEAGRWLFGYQDLQEDSKKCSAELNNKLRYESKRWLDKAKTFNRTSDEEQRRKSNKILADAFQKEEINLSYSEKVDFTIRTHNKYCTVIVGSIDWKFDTLIRLHYRNKHGKMKEIEGIMKVTSIRKIMGRNKILDPNLSEKEKEIFTYMIKKKLINRKHKVRLKRILFKEEGFLVNKLKKWKNHCKEKYMNKNPIKRKDKIKTKMKTKISENLYPKILTDHYYLKKAQNLSLLWKLQLSNQE
jgi:hypothetical protein